MMTNSTVSLKTDARSLNLEPEFRVVNQEINWSVKSTEYLADKTSILNNHWTKFIVDLIFLFKLASSGEKCNDLNMYYG